MNMSKESFEKFIEEQFDGGNNKCARGLDLAPSTVCRIANGNGKAGLKVITSVIKYCYEKDINYQEYVYLS